MRQLVGIIVIILVILGIWALVNSASDQDAERYAEVARTWVLEESPTYGFDGSDLMLTDSERLNSDSYQYTFSFTSNHGGYGDRTDEMVTQVITEHTVVVRVDGGQVVSAITDGVYDEMTGALLELPDGNAGDTGDDDNTESVLLYFYNEEVDTDETGNVLCSADAVLPVSREIDNYSIEAHIEALLAGPTADEEEDGLSSEYPLDGFALENASLSEDGVLTLTFEDPNNATTGGSCRAGILFAQIQKTAESIAGVESVVIEPETLFQP